MTCGPFVFQIKASLPKDPIPTSYACKTLDYPDCQAGKRGASFYDFYFSPIVFGFFCRRAAWDFQCGISARMFMLCGPLEAEESARYAR